MQTPLHLLRITLQSVRDAVVITDNTARIQTLNLAAEAMTGWSEAESVGSAIEDVIELRESATDSLLLNPAYAALREGERAELSGNSLLIGRDGRRIAVEIAATPLKDPDGTLLGAVIVFHNVSEAQQMAERIAYQAQHDKLTGLPNRILLVDRMEQATKFADRHSDQLAVLSLQVEAISGVEDSIVHSIRAGNQSGAFSDVLPKEVAQRLTANLRESDTVCRLGGSEFVILLPGIKSLVDGEAMATKLMTELTVPYFFSDNGPQTSLLATCSIGISLYPQDASDAGTLMRLADEAMLQAQKSGPNRYIFAKSQVEAGKAV